MCCYKMLRLLKYWRYNNFNLLIIRVGNLCAIGKRFIFILNLFTPVIKYLTKPSNT